MRLGLAPGLQPLWRHLILSAAKLPGLSCRTWSRARHAADAFVAGELDLIGVVIAELPSLGDLVRTPLRFVLPVTWMRVGMPIIARANSGLNGLDTLAGCSLATLPLDEPAMFAWRGLTLARTGRRLQTFCQVVEDHAPWELLEAGGVDVAVTTERAWDELHNDRRFRLATSLAAEWQGLTTRRLPIMGGFFGRPAWVAAHRDALERVRATLASGLTAARADAHAFAQSITDCPGTPPLSPDLAVFLIDYWGLDEVDAGRLRVSVADQKDAADLLRWIAEAGCCSTEAISAALAAFRVASA